MIVLSRWDKIALTITMAEIAFVIIGLFYSEVVL